MHEQGSCRKLKDAIAIFGHVVRFTSSYCGYDIVIDGNMEHSATAELWFRIRSTLILHAQVTATRIQRSTQEDTVLQLSMLYCSTSSIAPLLTGIALARLCQILLAALVFGDLFVSQGKCWASCCWMFTIWP